MTASWLAPFVCGGLGALLVWSGVSKVTDLSGFARAVVNYRLLPQEGAVFVAATLPWLEMFTGAGLWTRRLRGGAALLSAAMMLGFSLAVGSALWRGLDIACGCFRTSGPSDNMYLVLARNIALLGLCLWLVREWLRR